MNSSERVALRVALFKAGMKRMHWTQDEGDGRYSETWSNKWNTGDRVVIEWGPRTEEGK